jgi:hypothetical protein
MYSTACNLSNNVSEISSQSSRKQSLNQPNGAKKNSKDFKQEVYLNYNELPVYPAK